MDKTRIRGSVCVHTVGNYASICNPLLVNGSKVFHFAPFLFTVDSLSDQSHINREELRENINALPCLFLVASINDLLTDQLRFGRFQVDAKERNPSSQDTSFANGSDSWCVK